MPTCIETRIPAVAVQMFHALKEGNASEVERHFQMARDIVQYEQGATESSRATDVDVFSRILADFRDDPMFQSLAQVPQQRSSWATWAVTHPLPPKGPYIARVVLDYDPCLSAPTPASSGNMSVWLAAAGAVGLVAVLYMAQKR